MEETPESFLPPAEVASPDEAPIPLPQGEEALSVIEALLFSTTEPLKLDSISMLTGGIPREELQGMLVELSARYEARSSGLMVLEAAGGYQLATKPQVSDWVLQLHKHRKKNPITPALLETLAIVAYKQPIARSEIEAIRGVDCSGVLRALQDCDLVEVVGRREVAGRPSIYGTTQIFLKTFGLRSLEDLPQSQDMAQFFSSATGNAPKEEEPEAAPEVEPVAETAAETAAESDSTTDGAEADASSTAPA